MRNTAIFIVAGVVVLGLAFWFVSGARPPGDPATHPVTDPRPDNPPPPMAPALGQQPPGGGAQAVDELARLRAAKALADEAVEAADARLAALEQQIELIEMQIHDIEAGGDDPAERAGEVLPYLQPVLAEFLDAQAALEAALAEQAGADAALASALGR